MLKVVIRLSRPVRIKLYPKRKFASTEEAYEWVGLQLKENYPTFSLERVGGSWKSEWDPGSKTYPVHVSACKLTAQD